MYENDNNTYIDNTNTFNLKTMPVKDSEGNILEPSVYLDSDVSMNKVNDGKSPELTKEQLEKMKETIATEIDKTTKLVSYDDLIEVAVYNSSDAVREQAKEEIKRRIISGEVKYAFAIGHEKTPEQVAFQVLDNLDRTRREYLQSVDKNKGHTR